MFYNVLLALRECLCQNFYLNGSARGKLVFDNEWDANPCPGHHCYWPQCHLLSMPVEPLSVFLPHILHKPQLFVVSLYSYVSFHIPGLSAQSPHSPPWPLTHRYEKMIQALKKPEYEDDDLSLGEEEDASPDYLTSRRPPPPPRPRGTSGPGKRGEC